VTLVVASPPYAESLAPVNPHIDAKLVAAKAAGKTASRATWGANKGSSGMSGDIYGTSPGQLGAMPPGPRPTAGVTLVVASPPYGESLKSPRSGIDWEKQATQNPGHRSGYHTPGKGAMAANYGQTPGQLGAMPAGTPPSAGDDP
jgi:hypothetical protein